jgi:ssDNA thymidine ADP-ribosyltransferase, DarT
MKATYWSNTPDDPDRKERRQAECLVHPSVPWDLVEEVATKTEHARGRVEQTLATFEVATPVVVRANWYF